MYQIISHENGCYVVELSYAGTAGTLEVAGSFNDWDPSRTPMKKEKSGDRFSCRFRLKPGTYEYKFVLDGEWIADDANPNFTANDFGTLNSVITLE